MSSIEMFPPRWLNSNGRDDGNADAPAPKPRPVVKSMDRLDCLECGDITRLCPGCFACRIHCCCQSDEGATDATSPQAESERETIDPAAAGPLQPHEDAVDSRSRRSVCQP